MIEATDVTKSYGQTQVLCGISLRVDPGTIHGFVGPNGAGKSTFLKCLIGVAHPDGGTIKVNGIDARKRSLEVRRVVGYAPAETSLYHRMRARELVDFAIRYHPHSDPSQARELLDLLGVPPGRRVGALSHGMKRKLLMTQAIASRAPLMVLDEPMEALDPEARRIVEGLLQREADSGRTVFLSSHDLFSTQRLCSRVTFLHRGAVLRDGPVHELVAGLSGRLHVHLRRPVEAAALPREGGLRWSGAETSWQVQFDCELEEAMAMLASLPLASVRDDGGHLEDLFDRLYAVKQPEETAT